MTIQLIVKSNILDCTTPKIQMKLGTLEAAHAQARNFCSIARTITLTTKDAAHQTRGARGVRMKYFFPKANSHHTPITVKRMSPKSRSTSMKQIKWSPILVLSIRKKSFMKVLVPGFPTSVTTVKPSSQNCVATLWITLQKELGKNVIVPMTNCFRLRRPTQASRTLHFSSLLASVRGWMIGAKKAQPGWREVAAQLSRFK